MCLSLTFPRSRLVIYMEISKAKKEKFLRTLSLCCIRFSLPTLDRQEKIDMILVKHCEYHNVLINYFLFKVDGIATKYCPRKYFLKKSMIWFGLHISQTWSLTKILDLLTPLIFPFFLFFLLLEAWKPLQVGYLDWIFIQKAERDPTDNDSYKERTMKQLCKNSYI